MSRQFGSRQIISIAVTGTKSNWFNLRLKPKNSSRQLYYHDACSFHWSNYFLQINSQFSQITVLDLSIMYEQRLKYIQYILQLGSRFEPTNYNRCQTSGKSIYDSLELKRVHLHIFKIKNVFFLNSTCNSIVMNFIKFQIFHIFPRKRY